jgi:hypothetical protein
MPCCAITCSTISAAAIDELYRWLFGWFAHLMQRPRERLGTALVFRGRMGVGKTKLGEIIGSLIASHYFLVGDARYITGNFNAHMASCLLLQAEEAVWAGDKAAEGRLKDLVTAEIQMIEQKSIDPIRLKNFVRLIMTSNEDWVVPAGKDERRFAVLDVHPRCAQNHQLFPRDAGRDRRWRARGAAARSAQFRPREREPAAIPMTAALLEQKFRSLDSVENWWLERLFDGNTKRGGTEWVETVAIDSLFDDYIAVAEKIGVKRKSEKTGFGIKMLKLVPGLVKTRPWTTVNGYRERVWTYQLPTLVRCREAFETAVGQAIPWGDDDDQPTESDIE